MLVIKNTIQAVGLVNRRRVNVVLTGDQVGPPSTHTVGQVLIAGISSNNSMKVVELTSTGELL